MKKILVAGGVLTYMVLFNAGITSAQNLPEINASEIQGRKTAQNLRKEINLESKLNRLATKLGINPDNLTEDIKSGKSTKEILKKHGITNKQLKEILKDKRAKLNHYKK